MTLWIKICGNTSLADAQLAAQAGADALGFVFAPSPRQVNVAQAAAIVPHLPESIEKIGVFVDASFAEIEATVNAAGLTGVQLHFDAPHGLAAQLRARFGPRFRILGVVHFRNDRQIQSQPLQDPSLDAVLVDSYSAKAAGGAGLAFDWAAAKSLFQNANGCRCIAAGGLNPVNVAEAIKALRPWGVDVVSGVEAAPGRKDPEKLRAFIANARAAAPDSSE